MTRDDIALAFAIWLTMLCLLAFSMPAGTPW